MNILKKIIGAILFLISLILTPVFIISLIKTTATIPVKEGPERFGFIIGCVFIALVMICLLYFIVKIALKLFKNKPQNSIDEIGQS